MKNVKNFAFDFYIQTFDIIIKSLYQKAEIEKSLNIMKMLQSKWVCFSLFHKNFYWLICILLILWLLLLYRSRKKKKKDGDEDLEQYTEHTPKKIKIIIWHLIEMENHWCKTTSFPINIYIVRTQII